MALESGKLVFAKMRGFPYWPGIITVPKEEAVLTAPYAFKPGHHCVFFFGSKNYGWIEKDNIKLYDKFKEEMLRKGPKTNSFRKACDEMEKFVKKGLTLSSIGCSDPFDNLKFTPKMPKGSKKKASEPAAESPSSSTKQPKLSGRRVEGRKSFHSEQPVGRPKRCPPRLTFFEKSAPKATGKVHSEWPLSREKYSFQTVRQAVRPESPLVLEDDSADNAQSSSLHFGFIGLGKLGKSLVKNLLKSKHKITVWNRTVEKCKEFTNEGAASALTPAEVVSACDVTFCCVANDEAVRSIVFGKNGVLPEMKAGKSFIEMSGISPEMSQKVADVTAAAGGRYLEVRFNGFSCQVENRALVLLAAGERSLFDDCHSCFASMSSTRTYLGEVGKAATLYLFSQTILGTMIYSLSQHLRLASELEMDRETLLQTLLEIGDINDFIYGKCSKGGSSDEDNFGVSVKNMKKDILMFIQMSDKLDMPHTVASMAYEVMRKPTLQERDLLSLFH